MKKKKKKVIDWKGIEKDYRAAKISNRQIADWYGVSEGAIRKRAKAHNWSQMVRQEAVAITVRDPGFVPPIKTTQDAKEISKYGRGLAVRLLSELLATTTNVGELEDLIISETADDRDGRRRMAMLRAVDLPSRANTLKTLGLAVKAFIEAERGDKAPAIDPSNPQAGVEQDEGDDWEHLLN